MKQPTFIAPPPNKSADVTSGMQKAASSGGIGWTDTTDGTSSYDVVPPPVTAQRPAATAPPTPEPRPPSTNSSPPPDPALTRIAVTLERMLPQVRRIADSLQKLTAMVEAEQNQKPRASK